MMTKIKWFLIGVTSLFFLSSCNDEKVISNNQLVRSIYVTGQDFVDGDGIVGTRSSYSVDGTGFHFTWTQGDTVGIYPVGGDQVAFPISSGEGSQTAQFDGGAWALRSSYSYAAYYPFSSGNYHIDETSLPVNYVGQSQNGNGSLDCMDRFDYQASVATNPDADGNVNISLKHLGCFVRIQLTMPIADTYKSVTLQSNNTPFVTSGTYDLTQETVAITPITTSSSITIKLNNTSTTADNKVLTIYAMMAPADLSSSEITITVAGTTYQLYAATVNGKNMQASKAYSYAATVKSGTNINGSDVEWDDNGEEIIHVEYEYVDLGLPSGVKWANMNIGASSPSSEGTWFAFGDVIGSSQYKYYDEDVYVNLIGGSGEIYGPGDPLASYSVLPPSHDAATVLMGENWRTPTEDDFYELFNYCDVSVDGTAIRFISQINGAELILFRNSYWCSQQSSDKYAFYAEPEYQYIDYCKRQRTNQIRGVYGLPKYRPTLDYQVTISDITNTGALISSNITNDGGAEISERGFYIKIGSSSNYDVLVVPGAGVGEFSLTLSGLSHVTQYSVAAYATNSVGTSQSSWKSFRTDRNPIPAEYKGTLDGHDWVDIGLRKSHIDSNIVPGSSEDRIIAFATENIGASSPDNTGYYFRWGEQMGWDITVQDGYSSLREYSAVQRDRDGNVTSEVWSSSTFGSGYLSTGNNEERATGFFQDVTRKTDLQWYSYTYGDAATYNWGENWMTPSIAIFKAMLSVEQSKINFGEVSTNVNPLTFGTGANSLTLTISKETINGHLCLLLINDETDAYVIIPTYGGYTSGTCVSSYGSSGLGCYHTSSIRWDDKRYVPICRFDSWSSSSWFLIYSFGNKYEGRAVRPVTELTLDSKQPLFTDEEVPETIEEVDLGLSVKWASMNLGAKNKYDCGLFYRFGELTGHGCFDTFDRSWSSYFTSIGGNGNSSSDCGGSKDPLADYKGIVIPLEFDAAHETLGGTWRMPTRQEINELVDNCTFTWLSVDQTYSICAMKATSNVNGKSIIIPMSGCYSPSSTGYYATNSSGCFWSSSLGVNFVGSGYNISKAYYGVVSNSNYTLRTEYVDRNYAIPIRAVKE